jgi:hypothetical protein
MAVKGNTRVFVTDAGAAFTTDYDHKNWLKHDVSPGICLRSVVWSNDRFVAVGNNGVIATSTDGHCWDVFNSGVDGDLLSVIDTDMLVAVGTNGNILNSADGIEWERRPPGSPTTLRDILWSGQKLIAVGLNGEIHTSPNADNWEKAAIHGNNSMNIHSVAGFGNKFYAVCGYGQVIESLDGDEWYHIDIGVARDIDLWEIADVGERLLIGGDDGTLITTVNGDDWEDISVDDMGAIFGIAASDSLVIAVSTIGRAHRSEDGYNWFSWDWVALRLNDIVWTGDEFLAVAYRDIFSTIDGYNWEAEHLGEGFSLRAIASSAGKSVVVGSHGKIFTRTGGNWALEDSGMSTSISYSLDGITAYPGGFVIVGDDGIVLTQ